MKPVAHKLKDNRKILRAILKDKQSDIVSKEFLKGAGFEFGVSTRSFEGKTEDIIYHCHFEYVIQPLLNDHYKIFKANEALSSY